MSLGDKNPYETAELEAQEEREDVDQDEIYEDTFDVQDIFLEFWDSGTSVMFPNEL